MNKALRGNGFTLIELMVSMTIMLIVIGGALTTFQSAVGVTDSSAQISDANQNLRAGSNQLVRDVMQAGRIIGPEGIPVPSGKEAAPINRPGPPGMSLTFTLTAGSRTLNLPDISTGFELGYSVNGRATDIITILTIDPFLAPIVSAPSEAIEADTAVVSPDGAFIRPPRGSGWLADDRTRVKERDLVRTGIREGDLVLFKNALGSAVQTVTRVDGKAVYFDDRDWFNFNQRKADAGSVTQISADGFNSTTLFRLMMITYYIETGAAVKTSKSDPWPAPRLMRKINNFPANELAGVVEDLRFTYDLVDAVGNPPAVTSLPYTLDGENYYTSNQIRKVNIDVGVRSEQVLQQTKDYLRNHLSTSVDVRSLAGIDLLAEPDAR